MNISRKEFFKRSLFSLSEAVNTVTTALNSTSDEVARAVPDSADFVATPSDDRQAVAHNEHCLAKNSGCFACAERCDAGAIRLIPGVGIRINAQLCTGCGTCEYVCPVKPKAVSMQSRTVPNQ